MLEDAKNIAIKEYLENRGIETRKNGSKYFASSPFSSDRNWSFCIYPNNSYFDFSTGHGGDIISLVQRLEKCTFPEAIRHLTNNTLEKFKPNYEKIKKDKEFWKDFEVSKYISTRSDECRLIDDYALGRSIYSGYVRAVFFTREEEEKSWRRNPSLGFVHVDESLSPCGIKFRKITNLTSRDGHNGVRFSARGRLGCYILENLIKESHSRPVLYLVESETSANSLWEWAKEKKVNCVVISCGGVSSAPKRLPGKYADMHIKLIIDYDGNEKLYNERFELYKHLNPEPVKLILQKGEDINSLYHLKKMYVIENLL